MQKSSYQVNGPGKPNTFALHKITGDFKGKVSAYYDETGKLKDVELIRSVGGASYPVKIGGPIWRQCAALGQVWKDKV